MKLETIDARISFFSDIEKPERIWEDTDPSEEELNEFIKRRSKILSQTKDFRKSQRTKSQWRTSRFSLMKGIHKYHRSISGKKFHRQLGRFLATRVIPGRQIESKDKYEISKALSSMKTHLYIEDNRYKPLEEQLDYEFFMEYASPLLTEAEKKVNAEEFDLISKDEVELLLRLTDIKEVIDGIEEITGSKPNLEVEIDEDSTYGYTEGLTNACRELV